MPNNLFTLSMCSLSLKDPAFVYLKSKYANKREAILDKLPNNTGIE